MGLKAFGHNVEIFDFIEQVDNPEDADITISSDCSCFLFKPHIMIQVDHDQSILRNVLLDLYRGFSPESYIDYLISKSTNNTLCNILKSLPGEPGEENALMSFNTKFTTVLLQPLRREYSLKMLNSIKMTIEEIRSGSFNKFLEAYGATGEPNGIGLWSPEMIRAYIRNYLDWTMPEVESLYSDFVEQRTGQFLRRQLEEYFKGLPEADYSSILRDRLIIS